MVQAVAHPHEETVSFWRTGEAAPTPRSGIMMLQFLFARLANGGQVVEVSHQGFKIAKGDETVTFAGERTQIFPALALMKYCRRFLGREAQPFADGISSALAGLLSSVETVTLTIDQGQAVSFSLPQEMDALEKATVAVACNRTDPDFISAVGAQPWDEIDALAEKFLKQPYHKPTVALTCLR